MVLSLRPYVPPVFVETPELSPQFFPPPILTTPKKLTPPFTEVPSETPSVAPVPKEK